MARFCLPIYPTYLASSQQPTDVCARYLNTQKKQESKKINKTFFDISGLHSLFACIWPNFNNWNNLTHCHQSNKTCHSLIATWKKNLQKLKGSEAEKYRIPQFNIFHFIVYRTFIFLLLGEGKTKSFADQRMHSLDIDSTLVLPNALRGTARVAGNEATNYGEFSHQKFHAKSTFFFQFNSFVICNSQSISRYVWQIYMLQATQHWSISHFLF